MNAKPLLILLLLPVVALAAGHDTNVSDSDSLKIAALEALMSAPPEKALPIVDKVLAGNHSNEVKERALFILSQFDSSEAQATLLRFAREDTGELQVEAIRMIGIGGDKEALANLRDIYQTGNREVRDAVLEAYLIADDATSVYEIAVSADNEEDFSEAVDMLGAMGARDELRELRSRAGMSETLIDAYAISGDYETLRELALDSSDPELQTKAIEAMGIIGGDEVDNTLVEIYRGADSEDVREAALDGLLISGHDEGVLELYRAATDPGEKRQLLEYLVIMDSDAIYDVIDQALAGDR